MTERPNQALLDNLFGSLDLESHRTGSLTGPIARAEPPAHPPPQPPAAPVNPFSEEELGEAFFVVGEAEAVAETHPPARAPAPLPKPKVSPEEHARKLHEKFQKTSGEAERAELAEQLAAHAQNVPYLLEPHLLAGRMMLEIDRPRAAAELLRAAYELAPDRSDILTDLRNANLKVEAHRV